MDEMDKIAGEVPGIMLASAQQLQKLASTNLELIKRAESAEAENRVMKLARRMEVRGLQPSLTYEEKVAQLSEVHESKLATMEQAVELAAGGVRLGKVAEAPDTKLVGGTSPDELEDFINSQSALG